MPLKIDWSWTYTVGSILFCFLLWPVTWGKGSKNQSFYPIVHNTACIENPSLLRYHALWLISRNTYKWSRECNETLTIKQFSSFFVYSSTSECRVVRSLKFVCCLMRNLHQLTVLMWFFFFFAWYIWLRTVISPPPKIRVNLNKMRKAHKIELVCDFGQTK